MGFIPLVLSVSFLALAVLLGKNYDKILRLRNVNNLFREDLIVENFRNMHEVGFDTVNVSTRGAPVAFMDSSAVNTLDLPSTFVWNGTEFNTEQWIEDHWTTGIPHLLAMSSVHY